MATPVVDAQAAQAGLVTALGYDLERAFNTLDVSSLRQSLPDFTALIAALIHRYGLASATLAARSYRAQRAAAGIRTALTVRPAPLPPLPQVGATVSWATQPLWSATPDMAATQTRLAGAADMLVLDVGRQTIIDTVRRDRQAKGWARIPEPGACYFCAMLATRGAVYKQDTVGFRSHDHCRCHAEPVFTAYEPSAQVREWQGLYKKATAGRTGADARAAFRQAFEGRDPVGLKDAASASGKASAKAADARPHPATLLQRAHGSVAEFRRLLIEHGYNPGDYIGHGPIGR